MDEPVPDLYIPDEGRYIWDWYQELIRGVSRISDGVCRPIEWQTYLAWAKVTGHIVNTFEYFALMEIDHAFCDETNKEMAAYRERSRAAATQGTDKPKKRWFRKG